DVRPDFVRVRVGQTVPIYQINEESLEKIKRYFKSEQGEETASKILELLERIENDRFEDIGEFKNKLTTLLNVEEDHQWILQITSYADQWEKYWEPFASQVIELKKTTPISQRLATGTGSEEDILCEFHANEFKLTVTLEVQQSTPVYVSSGSKVIEVKNSKTIPIESNPEKEWIVRFGLVGKAHRIARFDWIPSPIQEP
ncbi:MAG: Txe/YoeB family toxin of Txe-Axe toxin-antitoxin module, partial [bacterium]